MPTTHYVWDPLSDNLLMETDETGATIAKYVHKPGQYGELISQRRNGVTSYYHYDGQGTTRQLTDDSGNVTDTSTYTAFGETVEKTGSTTNPFGFKGAIGYYANPETDDLYVRARTYQPTIVRWLSPDPLVFVGTVSGSSYSYAMNSPLILIDPSGLKPCKQRQTVTAITSLPSSTTNQISPSGPNVTVTLKHINLTPGQCGDFIWNAYFSVNSNVRPLYVIQHIRWKAMILDCATNKNITLKVYPELQSDNSGAVEFWESFELKKGESTVSDIFNVGKSFDCTRGFIAIIGRYIVSSSPPRLIGDWPHPNSGSVESTQFDPSLWFDWPGYQFAHHPLGRHDIMAQWDCCCKKRPSWPRTMPRLPSLPTAGTQPPPPYNPPSVPIMPEGVMHKLDAAR